MQLLYVWIKKYKNIEEQGFNFSSEFTFTYDKVKEELSGNYIPNDIPHFFDEKENILNITAILGKNGSGKSSLLYHILAQKENQYDYNNISIYLTSNKKEIKIFTTISNIISPKIPFFEIVIAKVNDKNSFPEFIFYSPFIDLNRDITHENEYFSDYSIEYLIQNDNRGNNDSQLEAYKYNSYKRWLGYGKIKKESFMPSECFIQLVLSIGETKNGNFRFEYGKLSKDENNETNFNYINQSILNKLSDRKINDKTRLMILFLQILFRQYFYYVSQIYWADIEISEDFLKRVIPTDIDKHIKYVKDFFEKQKWINEKEIYNTYIDALFLCIEKATKWEINGDDKFLVSYEDASHLLDLDHKLASYYKDKLKLKHEYYVPSHILEPDIQGISSGEKALLQLFSCLNAANKKLKDNKNINNYICILIDEGESGFHPQWQKEYIHNLITILPQIFEGKKLQIILTSHSPFIISDLPKKNVIFLDTYKEGEQAGQKAGNCKVVPGVKKEQTFGANIHTLLSDSFFMEGGLMGEFAKGKIQDVIDWLKHVQSIKATINPDLAKKYKQIIDMIGEPIIKNKLLEMYYNAIGNDSEIHILENEIAEKQKRINELKNKKGGNNNDKN